MKLEPDKSANGRGRMIHVGEVATILARWDGIMFGVEWGRFSFTVHLGPVAMIVYLP